MAEHEMDTLYDSLTHARTHACTHTHTHNRFTALWNLFVTTQVGRYQKKHSPTHTHR